MCSPSRRYGLRQRKRSRGLADGEGNLKEMIAAPDGVRLSAGNGYGAWVTYLRNHAKYSASNPWIMGSAYSAE